MEISHRPAAEALEELLYAKFRQAVANGATEDQALVAVRQLWLDATVRRAK
jgi:hypothetical protein